MAADADGGLMADALKFLGGALLMALGFVRFLYNIKRTAEDADAKADVNAERLESQGKEIVDLRLANATAEAKFDALLRGHERIEGKIDHLASRLGG